MKHCPYCEADYESKKTKCPNCQAVDAETRCDNCRTVHKAAFCPGCGFGVNDSLKTCPKCNKKTKERFCPDCGHNFSGYTSAVPGNQQVVVNVGASRPQNRTTTVIHTTAKAERKRTNWTVFFLIVFAPIGIPLMWMLKKSWGKNLKIILSIICGLFFCFAIAPGLVADSKPAVASDGSTLPAVQENKGVLGKYEVEIVSAVIENESQNSDEKVIVVTYSWTNNSEKDAKFDYTFKEAVYQGGALCESAFMDSDFRSSAQALIRPGASLSVKRAYEANDYSKKIEIEISEAYSSKTKVTKTFIVDD